MTECKRDLTEIFQYQEEADESKDGPNDKDVHILRAEYHASAPSTSNKARGTTFFVLSNQ